MNLMRILASIVVVGLSLVCGCRGKHYVRGQGDVGKFILQMAVACGGHPVATNALPAIGGSWQYIQDEYGIGILLPISEYQSARDFVGAAFGPRTNSENWSVRDCGVTIMVVKAPDHTDIGIYPAMSDAKLAQFAQQMIRTVQKDNP